MPVTVRDAVCRHAENAYPEEACGALLGRVPEPGVVGVTRAIPLSNSAPDAYEGFRVDAAELGRVCDEAARTRETLVGFYHSHPDRGTRPSAADADRALPGKWYVTVSVRRGRALARDAWLARSAPVTEAECPR
jgi:proteasome lid subunit RPN8/RPN11